MPSKSPKPPFSNRSPSSSPPIPPSRLSPTPPPTPPSKLQHTSSESTVRLSPLSGGPTGGRSRGPSISTIGPSLRRATGKDAQAQAQASPRTQSFAQASISRSSSRSPAPKWRDSFTPTAPEEPSPWWDAIGFGKKRRPWGWGDSDGEDSGDEEEDNLKKARKKKEKDVSLEQKEGWERTRTRVAQAAASILSPAADVAHEALLISVDVLKFAPIAGLSEAAKVLLVIWDSLQLVDMNRLACLRLTERCADILLSVREEIYEAGDEVGEELKKPIRVLIESFNHVDAFLQKQFHRPFLKRYLKRDEILKQISEVDRELSDALGMFSLSIQIRILKQVQKAEGSRREEHRALMNAIWGVPSGTQVPPPAPNALQIEGVHPPSYDSHLPPNEHQHQEGDQHPHPSPGAIQATLRTLHAVQNESDAAKDMVDLRSLMRAALSASNDVEMIEVLQVGREEMPEAIKTLQRALERVVEREEFPEKVGVVRRVSVVAGVGSGVGVGQVGVVERRGSTGGVLTRSKTLLSMESSNTSGSGRKDTLDREFIESGIDALRRMSMNSTGVETLPSWTITRYEVDREEKIGMGFFSDVYRGTWRNVTVAIKVLSRSTPRSLFIHEVEIWKELKHPNVLELYGASSASGEPPWFFVSRFCRGGSLVRWLKGVGDAEWAVAVGGGGNGSKGVEKKGSRRKVDLLRMMHEVAKGMEYLHAMGVLHGDLKASNVLVDDQVRESRRVRCVISDFGQSEIKSEVYRLSGTPPPHGTLRWQAPEVMSGTSKLTTEVDVYAFAISCVEILTKGSLPWPMSDDDGVRHFVLKENSRPSFPLSRITSPAFIDLLRTCWHRDPFQRPSFPRIATDMKRLRIIAGSDAEESPIPAVGEVMEEHFSVPSPDMQPTALPESTVEGSGPVDGSPIASESSYATAPVEHPTSPFAGISISTSPGGPAFIVPGPRTEDTGTGSGRVQMPEPVLYTPSINNASSIFESSSSESEDGHNDMLVGYEGYDSPPPVNERLAELRNERRYRMILEHGFHRSLTLPLWTPSPISLGAVGYLSKPSGTFVTLFNSFGPFKSSQGYAKDMPSLSGYGEVQTDNHRDDKRSVAQRGLNAIHGLLTFRSKSTNPVERSISTRYSFPLRAGHKTAHLCTDSTVYRYMLSLETPKKWFKANVNSILKLYGEAHRVQKEDLFLVVGALDASDYALFVSHNHPEGQAHFNVYTYPRIGQAWGTFTTDTFSEDFTGSSFNEESPGNPLSASKVSTTVGPAPWDTVLLARLRFKPDVLEPTSL